MVVESTGKAENVRESKEEGRFAKSKLTSNLR